ncbi:MAG: hypothetical protein KAJ63_06180 [Methyloprofundus sp.]|nr:hypothetical protein [Methyloprofundus sp.]
MKLISLLIALLLTGLLVKQQLDSSSSNTEVEEVVNSEGITTPKIPTSSKDIRKFEDDMNNFMQDTADKRAEKLEESLGK